MHIIETVGTNTESAPVRIVSLTTSLSILALFFFFLLQVNAEVVVNEALVNEPADSVILEWFELFNNSDSPVNLSFFEVRTTSHQFLLQDSLGPKGYAVICRDSVEFVNRWPSDLTANEYLIIERSFTLTNTSGTIELFRLSMFESSLSWPESGNDGVSWERVLPDEDNVESSVDPVGSTPGRLNSVTPLPRDLALEDVTASRNENSTTITFTIGNPGLTTVADGSLTLYWIDPENPDNRDSVILVLSVPAIDTGFTTIIQRTVALSGYYAQLEASLADDDRVENNSRIFFVPGAEFPPVIINEFLANPTGLLSSEWIELHNTSNISQDISSWMIGDSVKLNQIGNSPLIVDPGEYVVLVKDSLLFATFYFGFDGQIAQPSGWATLNNSGDVVRLVDQYGFLADEFDYVTVFDSNLTWSRSELSGSENRWGRSLAVGGTPGEINEVLIRPSESGLRIGIEPQIFSPDGNGVEDETTITISAPSSNEYTLKIYDRQGRLVRMFEDNSPYLADGGIYTWDGRSDSGNRLPIGIYILYFEAGGVESLKKTLVIAR